ncbi:nitroreductase family protein [Streptomyces spiramenti]|uniref:Nitroreductase n=1 Tax=Streptomyces spiramenti TaxID=2720606 RepID=A0ABX1AII9_9ACTN|nr:nitroreductase family protein [Streptomyces spiramenti]NJP66967.1 nitroreductase [Streptomyces spiramenti]
MGEAHAYATAIMNRGRTPMEPVDFVPNWADGPRKSKLYRGTDATPLPDGDYPADASLQDGLAPAAPLDGPGAAFDLDALGGMLRDSYGVTGRRLGVQANTDLSALPHYRMATWSRGSASGGGLYPVSVYWVSGASGPLTPGVHHYSTSRHSLQRLLTGDVSDRVRDALGERAPGPETDQYLVLGVKYWQNAFKYNSFTFHVVSMDVGALLATWRLWARARGMEIEPALWFDEHRLTDLLGVGAEEEGVFAVVPLRWRPGAHRPSAAPATGGRVGVTAGDSERSRTVRRFEDVTTMQRVTAGRAADRPVPDDLTDALPLPPDRDRDGVRVALPEPAPLTADVRTALRSRRSSFGRFDAQRPMTAAELAATLRAAHLGAELGGDTAAPAGGPGLTGLYVFVNHVADIAPGAYHYDPHDPEGPALRGVVDRAGGPFLQRNYFLANYNLEQAGAVLVPVARTHAVLDAVGDRGYRLTNALIGATAQATYTAGAALGLGCGVALGFDNISYAEELGLAERGESALLIMMVGRERPRPADFRYDLA